VLRDVTVSDWRRKHTNIRKSSGVLTTHDCLTKQKNNARKVIIKKASDALFMWFSQ